MINIQFQKVDSDRFNKEFTHSAICYLNNVRNSLMSTSSFYFPCEARELYQVRREVLLELLDDTLRLLERHDRTLNLFENGKDNE